jgi:hypothetical protein
MIRRGGQTLKEGFIGRNNILRQQILMPGEMMNVRAKGKVRLEALRERDVTRINATLSCFAQPVRWLESNWVDYVKSGTPGPSLKAVTNLAALGIGGESSTSRDILDFLHEAPINIHNKWFKWPEDSDITSWPDDGSKAVPLSSAWNRCRYSTDPGSAATDVSSVSAFDIRDLAKKEAEFKSAMKTDILSFGRYDELTNMMWKADGNREVDQVPLLLDTVEVGVNPREMPATDGASLGHWQSIFDFDIDHTIRGIVAPEHWVITWILTVRFPPILEGFMPLAAHTLNQWEHIGDPEIISAEQPIQVVSTEVLADTASSFTLGYLPAGWQWRCEHDVLGIAVDTKDTFAYMDVPTTQAQAKDATRIKNAFRSKAYGEYMVDCYFSEESYQPVGTSRDSYLSGMLDDTRNIGNNNDEFPFGGKML